MANSNTAAKGGKPAKPKKPSKDFPLYPHAVGRWAKKVRGRTVYFTHWGKDPKGVTALEMWLEQKDALLAGYRPRRREDELLLGDLVNQFLTHHAGRRDTGEINPRTFQQLYSTCDAMVEAIGRGRAVIDLQPADFAKLKAALGKTRSAVTLRNVMQRCRSAFKFAFDEGLIISPIRFGQSFAKPKVEVVERDREAHRAKHGDRMFEATEIRHILANAKQPLTSMVLLAANCAFGQTDIANLPIRCVDLDAGWVDFARVKTSVHRHIPLWPETVAAVRAWLPQRPKAKDKADDGLMFITRFGGRWITVAPVTGMTTDSVGREFAKLVQQLGLKRSRVNFYAFRRVFETIGGETLDQNAVDVLMGHKIPGMKANYIERIGDDRLQRVIEHVREWMFGGGGPKKLMPQTSGLSALCGPNPPGEGENTAARAAKSGAKF